MPNEFILKNSCQYIILAVSCKKIKGNRITN